MDNAKGGEPSTGTGAGAADAAGDWRSNLLPEARGRIVNKIMETMKKHLPAPVSMPEVLAEVEVRKLAERFEEKIFVVAVNQSDYLRKIFQSDYLRKICLRMINIKSHNKTNTQESPHDVQVVQNQRHYDLASRGSTSHAGDLKEELTQMNKILKDQYLAGLGRDNAVPTQELIQVPGEFPGRQGMDNIQGGEPSTSAGAGAADTGGDWRSNLLPGARDGIVNKITESLKKYLPEGLAEIRKIAGRFEEKIFTVAVSESDYRRKIALKMLTLENKTNTQENPQGVQLVQNQRPGDIASRGSTSYIGSSNAGDLKEDLSQMNKMLKDQYLSGLGDLYETYIQLGRDNPVPTQGPIQVPEEVNFKLILEHSLDFVQISKKPSLEESTPLYKREILSLVNSEEWTLGQKLQQSAGQAPGTSSSGVRAADGILSPERGNAKRLRLPLEGDMHR